ncbi:MAG: multiheme c-type cytochrome ExtKL [Candidatus Magnetobacterium sp. LHC-1]|uniref:Cytochrome c-552/4 domain-containing protein n=1 Tax=Candidatus Magnetobacterium casense TaxID=1455061 RepID=A0ABS6RUV0_9BACT|nr:multiheme c-type cytochrome ExtKL [Candidatus Magnetobacterium casensis]MBF0606785.1 hypothetical protein [Nitrospirota bacterium]MBV6340409.1 hypothetical protein [Candidatus Magnetobacterium casensis]
MRTLKLFVLLTLALGLLVPSIVMARADDTGKEVKTVKELIAMYDSTRCKQCHEQIYKDWEKSLHSKPLIGPFSKTLGTLIDYMKQRDGELKKSHEITKSIKDYMMPCFICHIPQLEDASEAAAQEIADAVVKQDFDIIEKLQINCIICHNRNAFVRTFRDGAPAKDTIYGNKEIGGAHADSVFTKSKRAEMMEDSSFCGRCHQGPNLLHSAEPMWCVSNYDSWLQNYIPNGGDKGCQDCHMRAPNTGHRFPPNYDDREFQMKRLKEHIKFDVTAMAYTFKVKLPEVLSIPQVVIKTKITHDIGHRFPDGCPSPTHFSLKVKVKSKDGKEIFSETKYYMPQKKLGYQDNTMVFASLRKLSLMRDTSLQPFKANEETFEVKLPPGVEDAVVEASLTLVVEPGVKDSVYELGTFTKEVSLKGQK